MISFFSNSNIALANIRNTIINKSNCTTRTAKYRSDFQPKFLGDPSSRKGRWYYCISSNGSKYEVLSFFDDGDMSSNMHSVKKLGYLNKENVEMSNDGFRIQTKTVFSEEGFPLFGRLSEYECSKGFVFNEGGCSYRVLGKRTNIIP